MELQLSEVQRELVDGVDHYLRATATSERARASIEREPDGYDRELWQEFAALGVLGLAIDEEFGGMGMGELELGLIAECAGRYLLRAPLGSTVWRAAAAIQKLGSHAQKILWLPKIASGEITAAYIDAGVLSFTKLDFAGDRLSGEFPVVADAMAADLLVLIAPNGAWLVASDSEGVERQSLGTFDLLQPSARVVLSKVAAEPMAEVPEQSSLSFLRRRGAVLTAFEQVGMCQAAIDEAVAYAKDRHAFGRQVGSFQAVKHLLANMYVKMELARSNSYYAGWALATGDADLGSAAAAAHLSATDALRQCAADAIQIHGGIGFTWEMDCHIRYRRAHHLGLQSGPARPWQDELVDALASQAEAA